MNILQKAYNRVQAYFVASAPFAMLKMALAGRTNTAASQYISYQAKMLRVETLRAGQPSGLSHWKPYRQNTTVTFSIGER